jgi:hypothetical protein
MASGFNMKAYWVLTFDIPRLLPFPYPKLSFAIITSTFKNLFSN